MEYNVVREIKQYEGYLTTLTSIDKNYLAYVKEKERRRGHWQQRINLN